MKLKEHPGFKRLAVFISLVSFAITLILLIVDHREPILSIETFQFAIVALLIALITFIFVNITYWVVDGFRKEEE